MSYTCQCCFKTYKNKGWYDKHIIWCFKNSSIPTIKRQIEELEDTPSVHTMFKMILDLATKVNQLEQKCYELSRTRREERNNEILYNPPDFMREKPTIKINAWLNNIKVTKKNVSIILDTGYEKEIAKIVISNISETGPFVVYNNDIYIYESEKWSIIKSNSAIINNIVQKIQSDCVIVYQEKDKIQLSSDDEILNICEIINDTTMSDAACTEFTNNVSRLMSQNICNQTVFNLIKNK